MPFDGIVIFLLSVWDANLIARCGWAGPGVLIVAVLLFLCTAELERIEPPGRRCLVFLLMFFLVSLERMRKVCKTVSATGSRGGV